MLRLAGRSSQVAAEDVIRAIRRAIRKTKDELVGVVVRKLGEDAVYLYDMLNVDSNGRPNKFSVFELYSTYLSSPKELSDDAARIDYVSQLYSRGQGDVQAPESRIDWIRSVVWPKLDDDERLQLQAVADFILGKFYGFEWDKPRYNIAALSTLSAVVWPLVEREKKWARKYRGVGTVAESLPEETPVLLLGAGDEPNPPEETKDAMPDLLARRRQRMTVLREIREKKPGHEHKS